MLSVIIPVFNAQSGLKRCLDSVLGQSYQEMEIILVDDGSTDDSLKICQNYADSDSRVRVLHQKNAGPAAARNRGLELAKGEYVAFVDADDWIETDTYQVMMAEARACDADMVICGYRRVWPGGAEKGVTGIAPALYDLDGCRRLTQDLIFSPRRQKIPPFLVIRLIKKSLIDLHGFRFDETVRRTEDFLFLAGVHMQCRTVRAITDREFYQYVQNENSITHTYVENYWEMILHIFNTLVCDFSGQAALMTRLQQMLVYRGLLAVINEAGGRARHPVKRIKKIIKTPALRDNLRCTGWREGITLYGKGFVLMKLQAVLPLYLYAGYQTHCERRRMNEARRPLWGKRCLQKADSSQKARA